MRKFAFRKNGSYELVSFGGVRVRGARFHLLPEQGEQDRGFGERLMERTASAIALSLYIVTKVLKTLPIGTAYAVWTGIGAVGTVIIGIVFFKEPVSFGRLFFIFTLIVSIVGLKVVSS